MRGTVAKRLRKEARLLSKSDPEKYRSIYQSLKAAYRKK